MKTQTVVVGVLLAGAGLVLLTRKRSSSSSRAPAPNPFRGPHAPVFAPVDISSGVAQLEPGETYLATVDVPFLAEALVGSAAIRDGLERENFVPITVTQERPPWWPEGGDDADWFIVASYSGEPRARELPGSIVNVWTAEPSE